MSPNEFRKLFPNASTSTIARNLDLGRAQDPKPEPDPVRALVACPKTRPGQSCRVVCRVSIISCRRRLLDYVNLVAGAKGLQDAIAADLGVDDADPRVEWEFLQVKTAGCQGTIVTLECL